MFRQYARDEPGFKLTKPSTGQGLRKATITTSRNEKYNGRTIQGRTLNSLQLYTRQQEQALLAEVKTAALEDKGTTKKKLRFNVMDKS